MKKLIALGLIAMIAACSTPEKPQTQQTYPYGMSEQEWNQLSVKDKANIRRDFYFYEKGSTSFVNPQLEVEGKKEDPNLFLQQNRQRQVAPKTNRRGIEMPLIEE